MTTDEAARRRQLTRLTRIWRELDQQAITEYITATNDLTPDELETAVTHMIRDRRTRPTPRDIRDAIHPTPPEKPNMTRTIDLAPHLQTPGPDGIRPYVHDAIRAYQRTGLTDYLRMIRDADDELNDTEQAHIANLIHNDATAA